jgi:hypothetical protein
MCYFSNSNKANDMKISQIRRVYLTTGLLLLFAASCDRGDEVMKEVPGKPVSVRVNIVGVREGGSKAVMRSASVSPPTGRPETAMAIQPLGNGMVLDMSLEPDETSPLRATTQALESGKKFRVIALKNSDGTYVSHGDYTVASDGSYVLSGTFLVPENVNYDFVCLSYNSTSAGFTETYTKGQVPANLAVPIDGKDLLYAGMTKTITAADRNLSFTLTHQLSKVRLVVDGTYNGWNITAMAANKIYLSPSYSNATMHLQTGVITAGAAAGNQYFTWPSISAAQTQTSNARAVYTGSGTIALVVSVGAITMNGNALPSVENTISLTATTLDPAYDYTLRLRIRIPRWAGSNIYWDNTKLVFDPEGTTARQGYQGVLFKFGSLVGISPQGNTFANNSTPVYRPNGSGWLPTTYSTWGGIPLWTSTYGNLVNNNYTSSFIGDICQYIGTNQPALTGYRLPVAGEFGTATGYWDSLDPEHVPVAGGWVKGDVAFALPGVDVAYAAGTADFLSTQNGANQKLAWVKNLTMGSLTLPVSGYRSGSSGQAGNVNIAGYYWTGSATSTSVYGLVFSGSSVAPANTGVDRTYATPVRCVKN